MPEHIIRERMRVYTREGVFAGRVIAVGDNQFEIERGVLMPHDFLIEREQVAYSTLHEVVLKIGRKDLIEYHADVGTSVAPHRGNDTSEPLAYE